MSALSAYRAAHKRVVDVKGPARQKPCEFCGGFASDWAYDHMDPDEIYSDGYLWSNSTAHYMPLCSRDHRAYDRAFRRHGKEALPAVAQMRREATPDYDERRRSVEATADSAWRAREAALPESVPRPDRAAVAANLSLLSRAYGNNTPDLFDPSTDQ